MIKKIALPLLSLSLIIILAGCGNHTANSENLSTSQAAPEKESPFGHPSMNEKTPSDKQTKSTDTSPNVTESAKEQSSSQDKEEASMDTKILVAYFSCTNTTKQLAEYAAEILDADLYEIVPEDPYTEEDLAYYTGGRADKEQNDPSARPAISGQVEDMSAYNTIVLGYPIWHGQAPRIINTFLESYDFSGKTILPFCTSHSSGVGSSASNLHSLCPESTEWLEGERFGSGTSRETLEDWITAFFS